MTRDGMTRAPVVAPVVALEMSAAACQRSAPTTGREDAAGISAARSALDEVLACWDRDEHDDLRAVVVAPSLELVVAITSRAYRRGYGQRRSQEILLAVLAALTAAQPAVPAPPATPAPPAAPVAPR